jgi:hypothetical protein
MCSQYVTACVVCDVKPVCHSCVMCDVKPIGYTMLGLVMPAGVTLFVSIFILPTFATHEAKEKVSLALTKTGSILSRYCGGVQVSWWCSGIVVVSRYCSSGHSAHTHTHTEHSLRPAGVRAESTGHCTVLPVPWMT